MAEQSWADIVRPMADKLILPAKMGLTIKLNPDAAKAQGKTIMKLAEALDATDASRHALRQLRIELTKCAAFVAVMVVATILFN